MTVLLHSTPQRAFVAEALRAMLRGPWRPVASRAKRGGGHGPRRGAVRAASPHGAPVQYCAALHAVQSGMAPRGAACTVLLGLDCGGCG